MNKILTDQALQTKIDQLNQDIDPDRNLWTGIEHAIEHLEQNPKDQQSSVYASQKTAFFQPVAWAASVVFAIAATWYFNGPMGSIITQPSMANLNPIDVIESEYQQQKNTMLVSFGQPDLAQLPADIQQQFLELKTARESLITALSNDPNNVNLLNLLRWTQKQELSLLEQLYSPQWQTI